MGKGSNTRSGTRMRRERDREPEQDGLYLVMKMQIIAAVIVLLAAWWIKGGDNYQEIRGKTEEMLYCQQTPEVSEMAMAGLDAVQDYFNQITARVNGVVYEISREETQQEELTGQGGWNPFDQSEQTLEIPADASLAMVVTNAVPLLPVEGTVTSVFGYRIHPITGNPDFHMGLDIAAREGTEVLCALPGTVSDVGESTVYGNYVVVEHSGSFKTRYCHLSEVIAKSGDRVRQGSRIATVGNTGMSTGPHLHFDVIVDGKYTNPIWILEELKEYRGTIYTSNRTVDP